MPDEAEARRGLVIFFRRLVLKAAGGAGKHGLDVLGSSIFLGAWPLIKAALDPVIQLLEDELDERLGDSPEASERGARILAENEQLQALLHDSLAGALERIDEETMRSSRGVQALLAMVGGAQQRLEDIEGHLVDLEALIGAALEGDGVRLSETSVTRVVDALRRELVRDERVIELMTGTPAGMAPPGRQLWLPLEVVDRQVARIIARAGELLQGDEPARALDELDDGTLLLGELVRKTPSSPRLRLLGGHLKGKVAQARLASGDEAAARAELTQAVELLETVVDAPDGAASRVELAEAVNGLGGAFATLGRHDEALALHRRAAGLAPQLVYAWHDLLGAQAALMRQDMPVPVEEMREALERVQALGGGTVPGIDSAKMHLLRSIVERAERAAVAGLPPGPSADRILELTERLQHEDDQQARARLLEERAGHHLRLRRSAQALSDAEAVLAVDERRAPALVTGALAHLDRGGVDAALDDLGRLVALDGANSGYRLLRARVLREHGDPREALLEAQEGARLAPDSSSAHLERARALGVLGRYEDAAAAAGRALELEPGLVEALDIRAHAQLGASRLDEALADVERALDLAQQPHLLALRAAIHERRGQAADATADYQRALGYRPEDLGWRRGLARSLTAQGALVRAERAWSIVTAAAPDDAEARRARSELLLRLGRPGEAVIDCNAVLGAASDDPVLVLRALARRELGDLRGCLEDLDRCLALGVHDTATVLAARARGHRHAGDLPAALADLDRAVALGGGIHARRERGLVHAALGRLDDAVRDLAAVHAQQLPDEESAAALAQAQAGCGQLAAAIETLDEGLRAVPGSLPLRGMRAAYRLEHGELTAAVEEPSPISSRRSRTSRTTASCATCSRWPRGRRETPAEPSARCRRRSATSRPGHQETPAGPSCWSAPGAGWRQATPRQCSATATRWPRACPPTRSAMPWRKSDGWPSTPAGLVDACRSAGPGRCCGQRCPATRCGDAFRRSRHERRTPCAHGTRRARNPPVTLPRPSPGTHPARGDARGEACERHPDAHSARQAGRPRPDDPRALDQRRDELRR